MTDGMKKILAERMMAESQAVKAEQQPRPDWRRWTWAGIEAVMVAGGIALAVYVLWTVWGGAA